MVPDPLTLVEPTPELPQTYAPLPATPKPINPATSLRFALPEPVPVRLDAYDIRGFPAAENHGQEAVGPFIGPS